MPYTPKDATSATSRANREAVARYDMADRQDFADADRGLIAGFPDRKVLHADGTVMFDLPGWITSPMRPRLRTR